MKRLMMFVALVLAVCLVAGSGFSEEKKPTVTGSWKCVAKSERGPSEFALDLVQKGSEVTGTASRSDGSTDIQKGSFEDGKLKLTIEADGGDYQMEATLSGNKLTGTLSHTSGGKADWEGTREEPAASTTIEALLGTWKTKAETGGGTVEYTLEFKKDGDALAGTLTTPDGQTLKLTNTSFADNVVKFVVTTDDGDYKAEGKVNGKTIKGNYVGPDGGKGAWEASKT